MSHEWPADHVERRPVAALVPYARNARTHSPAQVDQIAASIREWGWTTPVLVDEQGGIIAGHGRILAAQKLGIPDVPTMVAAGWSEAQKRAYVLADNKLALNAGWDDELLRVARASKMAGVVSNGGLREKDGTIGGRSKGASAIQATKIPDSVIRVMRHKGGLGDAGRHPAVFPVDLPGEFILAFSDPDDLVFEPFCGSGTQLIAAQKNGRSCYGIEIAPLYADVCVRRWQNFTGQQAMLEATGETFAEKEAACPT